MSGLFSQDGFIGKVLGGFTDLLTLSILWMICSIPIVTAGASTAALYTMTLRIVRGEEGRIGAGFFHAFRENFKSATVIHLLVMLLGFLLFVYGFSVGILPANIRPFFRGASILFWMLWLMEVLFVYAVQARFENTVWNIMRNAWLMAAGSFPYFLLIFFISGIPVWTFWLNTGKVIYQLAEPPYTKDNPPFVFIKDMNSLMKGDLSTGDYILNVDEATRAILRDLGWDAPATALISIAGDDVDDTGLASAYSSHKFRINKGNLSISDPKWVLELPLADGKTQSMQLPDNNLSCTTPSIKNEKDYKINSDGDIEAQLKFTCTIDGVEAKASFKIYFELKPLIEYAVIERIEDNAPYDSYNAYYKVKYRGAEKIQIYVEEEYAPKVKYSVINEPYIAHGMADHITAPFFAWINFVAENEYGKSIYTIELEPYGAVSDNSGLRDDSLVTGFHSINIDRSDDCRFEVYDAWGRKLGVFTDMSEIKSIPQKGILIIRHINGQSVKTLKFVNK